MVDCTRQHTGTMGVYNKTQRRIIISFVQGKCQWDNTPPGFKLPAEYVTDTGVQMVDKDLNPGQSALINDLCRDLGILIPATLGEIAVKITQPTGPDKDLRDVAPKKQFPTFYSALTWQITEKALDDKTGETEYQIDLMSADSESLSVD